MNWNTRFGRVRQFHQRDFPMPLRLPEGSLYVEGSTIKEIEAALDSGYAVYGEGCNGRIFVWADKSGYEADLFFIGPARPRHFDNVKTAADFAAELCES